jgi:hypothetical protein
VSNLEDSRVLSAFSDQQNALSYMIGLEQRTSKSKNSILKLFNDIENVKFEYVKRIFDSVLYSGYLVTSNSPSYSLVSIPKLTITAEGPETRRAFYYFHTPVAYIGSSGWAEIGLSLNGAPVRTYARITAPGSANRNPLSFYVAYLLSPGVWTVELYVRTSGVGVTLYLGDSDPDYRTSAMFFQL